MSESYFDLPFEVQKSILQTAADQLNISDVVVEKDIWVCWILKQLFSLPVSMAFKGGTSLSKAYKLISRFSEDVNITVDYRNFNKDFDVKNSNRSQLKKNSDELRIKLIACVQKEILPFLNQQLLLLPNHEGFKLEFDGKENLRFYYPSALEGYLITENGERMITEDDDFIVAESRDIYLRDHVLIEFGARNSIEPYERHTIKTLLSQIHFEKPIELPEAKVDVLSVIRTFWEKATLIHVECHRKRLRENSERLSRHWYDLAMLINAGLGKKALDRLDILNSVVEHKWAFFNASYAHYDECLKQNFRLLPDEEDMFHLEKDYKDMINSGMFPEVPMLFLDIIDTLKIFEKTFNSVKEISSQAEADQ